MREQACRTRAEEGCIVTAKHLMSMPTVTVYQGQPVPRGARVVECLRIERLPVVDEEDRLIGIASRRDLLRVFLRTEGDIRREVIDQVLGWCSRPGPGTVNVLVRDGLVTPTRSGGAPWRRPEAIRAVWPGGKAS